MPRTMPAVIAERAIPASHDLSTQALPEVRQQNEKLGSKNKKEEDKEEVTEHTYVLPNPRPGT